MSKDNLDNSRRKFKPNEKDVKKTYGTGTGLTKLINCIQNTKKTKKECQVHDLTR